MKKSSAQHDNSRGQLLYGLACNPAVIGCVPMIRRQKLIAGTIALVTLSVIPIPYLASPEWSVTVVDTDGSPLQGMTVRLSWQNYSVENDGHEQDLTTDPQGRVNFPRHIGRASVVQRCFFTAQSAAAGVHAAFGPHVTLFAFGKGREGDAVTGQHLTDWIGKPGHMESTIVAKIAKD
jgi:hypothetical protein